MVNIKIGKRKVEIYNSIEELPIVRFHKYQKLLLIDAGIGSDIISFDRRMEKARRFLSAGKADQAMKELDNVRQSVWMMQNGISPRNRAFAALIKSVDGVPCDDISDEALEKLLDELREMSVKQLADTLESVKKKIDGELMLYFPRIFEDSTVKEYYDILRKRTVELLNNIIAGKPNPDATPEIEKLTTALITFSKPQLFSGSESAEIQFDRQFEDLCLALSENLHVNPKSYNVLEFYNAFDFLKERARKAEAANKGRNSR